MNITQLDLINLISSLASLILSIIAIWLSLYFFKSSKSTEKEVNEALTEIKTHTGTLERLTGKWMDRLTRFVTSPQPMDAMSAQLLEIIKVSSTTSVTLPSPEGETKTQLAESLVASYIAIYYYTALSNISSQFHLPVLEEIETAQNVKSVVDKSYVDFFYIEGILTGLNTEVLGRSSLYNLYQEAILLRNNVKDTTTVYSERAQQASISTGQ